MVIEDMPFWAVSFWLKRHHTGALKDKLVGFAHHWNNKIVASGSQHLCLGENDGFKESKTQSTYAASIFILL